MGIFVNILPLGTTYTITVYTKGALRAKIFLAIISRVEHNQFGFIFFAKALTAILLKF